MTPVACWFVAYAVYMFCVVYYAKINPDFAMWMMNKAQELEQKKEERREQRRRDKSSH